MHFNPARFNAHLDKMGQDFKWRRASSCPCITPHSGAARTNCPQCSGKGTFWAAPVDARAGVAGQKVQLEWAQHGLYESGDVVLTIQENSPLYELGQFDRVVMLNSMNRFSITLRRGQTDRLLSPVKEVTRLFWLDANSVIVEGPLPSVAADGTLSWTNGGPPQGSHYTCEGVQHAEYFCWGPFPSNRMMHAGARLPRRVVLRTFDLFGR